jgi:antitoxin ParD1/3/4
MLMANIERMTVVFPEPMAANIRAAVEAGDYATTSEAVRDAVRLWTDKRGQRQRDIEMMRHAWDAGKASGSAGPLDIKSLIKEAESDMIAENGISIG